MKKILSLIGYLLLACSAFAAGDVLIVADEIPAMELLAGKLKAEEDITSKVVLQTAMPADLSAFSAVMVYIHKGLDAAPEHAFIEYAKGGGKLILLHHSFSSGKH